MATGGHFFGDLPSTDGWRSALAALNAADETSRVETLIAEARFSPDERGRIANVATALVKRVRQGRETAGGLDAFLGEYDLSTREGVVLMCLAEALLRIPDSRTADRLIRDKLADADWESHLGHSTSLFVNASTWGLMLTGELIRFERDTDSDLMGLFHRLLSRSGEPVIRRALVQAMGIMGRQFVMGRTIEEALDRADDGDNRHYRHSFDMLGEAARTRTDAEHYFDAYMAAIEAIGKASGGRGVFDGPGLSVKLSALHPRYERSQRDRVLAELVPALTSLAVAARTADIGFTIDAEESTRLELSLDIIQAVFDDAALEGWEGFGVAVQAYQKRAPGVIDRLADLARARRRRMMVRLVKGAYWDSEIKRAQERGLDSYPVFTRKVSTDVSYLACAGRLLVAQDAFYPQFATHNAHTLAAVAAMAGERKSFEFQRLHGMGEALYDPLVDPDEDDPPGGLRVRCRVYAPVGSHEALLPYLVRRLLENGANTSFVNRLVDEQLPVADIVADPVEAAAALEAKPHPKIPAPQDMLGPDRRIARGRDLTDPIMLAALATDMDKAAAAGWHATPLLGGGLDGKGVERPITDPTDRRRTVGTVADADAKVAAEVIGVAAAAQPDWDGAGAERRAECLERAADLFENNMAELMALAVREAGKSLQDAVAEVREAIDFCRYYAVRARADFSQPQALPGPTGEVNEISLHGRGVVACISPWNFPMAIFTGQVAAALVAGNAVIAKPAEQTCLIGWRTVQLLHDAGVPRDVLQLLPGDGATVGAALVNDSRVAGVAFTGSTETAWSINRALAARDAPIASLIAETGGQNAMVVDSSALAEQVVADVVTSSFLSAGQRCSALRVLFLQDEVAAHIIAMLGGAMAELRIGDPGLLATDVGPVIDDDAKSILETHAARMEQEGKLIHRCALADETKHGTFFAPAAFEIDRLDRLTREVFGPILHVVRYSAARLDDVIAAVNATGYGLTLGVHSRVDSTVRQVLDGVRAGNAYVNRSMVGAVVGVQPFGGEGLSGTGPKAGGPRYLHRFAVERAVSIDTTAAGGNASLLTLED